MATHNEFGRLGEELAVRYLMGKGYKILERNWRTIHKEIDILAKDGKDLVVVEVKTRKTDEYGDPDIAVTKQKQRLLIWQPILIFLNIISMWKRVLISFLSFSRLMSP